jgi:hypothetical protein
MKTYRLEGLLRVTKSSEGRKIRETFHTRREAEFRKEDLELPDIYGLSDLRVVEVDESSPLGM